MTQTIGNYQILSELGRGGMGVVYKAFEPALSRNVALKMLNEGIAHDQGLVERFYREARAMATLNDPNVVQIHAVGEHQSQPYFVMEFVDGESLGARLKRERLSVKEARRIVAQAASGLQAAHERGLIHRDIKPGNLMLTQKGLVKVTDFGIALKEGSGERLTGTGGIVGTPGYLSPEACLGESLDVRTDIFALGVVFFEMLTGRLPFDDKSPYALMAAVVQAQIPDVRTLNAEVDLHTMQVLSKMLARRPEDRYQSCAEIEAALLQTATPLPPSAPQAMRDLPAVPPDRRDLSAVPPDRRDLYVPPIVAPAPQTPYPIAAQTPYPSAPAVQAPYPIAPPAPVYPSVPTPYPPQSPAYPSAAYPQPSASYAPAGKPALTIMPAQKKSSAVIWIVGGSVALFVLMFWALSMMKPSESKTNPNTPVVTQADPQTNNPTTSETNDPSTPVSTPATNPTMTENGRPNIELSTLSESDRALAARAVLGTYFGKIGNSPLQIVLQSESSGAISGYNDANGVRRPVNGYVETFNEEIDADGDTWRVYSAVLHEPGDSTNDGKFRVDLKHTDEYVGGDGSWIQYSGASQFDIKIERFNSTRE
jgi:eukaryotic-like serine/threonine-protein kinase